MVDTVGSLYAGYAELENWIQDATDFLVVPGISRGTGRHVESAPLSEQTGYDFRCERDWYHTIGSYYYYYYDFPGYCGFLHDLPTETDAPRPAHSHPL